MAYTFSQFAIEVLQHTGTPMSAVEIWVEGERLGLTKQMNTSGKTPWRTLGARLYMDIKENPQKTCFCQVTKRPAKFGLKALRYGTETVERVVNSVEAGDECPKIKERDLHILLSTFVRSSPHFKCYTRTIYHENSRKAKKGYNKWLHPDIIGVYFPFREYNDDTLKLLETLKENPYKLFSFEMKIKISFSNLRECYFQALSNSSWAHEGYLVTSKLEDDPALHDELRRLNNAFGIGVIQLDQANVEQSEILFTAMRKETLDWETVDRLAEENPDFSKMMRDIMEDIKIGKVKSHYDEIQHAD